MNFEPYKKNEVIQLWSTKVMKQRLPDVEFANPLLSRIATSGKNNIEIGAESEVVKWLYAQIDHGAQRFLTRANLNVARQFRIMVGFEVHHLGDYRSLANEPGAFLTGRYGVTLPKDSEPGPTRDDFHPGYISFYDPRSAMNMNAINRDPYLNYHRSIELKPGLLLMWPSYLSYFIHPNLSQTPRISVAFNIYKGGEEP